MATAPTPHELYPNLFPPPEAPLDQQQQHQQPQEPPRQSPKEQAGEERQPSVESPSFSSRPSVGRAAATTEASPPPTSEPVKKPFISKAGELTRFEVLDTLGTGTFGRVLLVRVRSPSTSPTAPHPIFASPSSPNNSTTSNPASSLKPGAPPTTPLLPHFALKVLAKTEIVRLKQVEHIKNERLILSKAKHPFIVELYQTYQDELNVYMLLSYVPGGELFSHLRRAGRFTPDVTRFYISTCLLAIAYLHSNDIIYRDLKPENLLLDREGYLRITDFGFAKVVEDRTWTLCGTPEYLSPEVILNKGHSKAVDWWSLGILLFEMLAGYPPFYSDNPLHIYEKILAANIAFPPSFDPYAKDLIRRLLTVDRSKRLGNLRGGAFDIMMHPWFSGVDWGRLERKKIQAPIIPPLKDLGDSSNFQKYPPPRPEDLPGMFVVPPVPPRSDPYSDLFPEF